MAELFCFEVNLDEASIEFRESVAALKAGAGKLNRIPSFLFPDEISYRDGLPRAYQTKPMRSRYAAFTSFLAAKPPTSELMLAALGLVEVFAQFEKAGLSYLSLGFEHFIVNDLDPSDVRVVYTEPFSLDPEEAFQYAAQREPALAASASMAAFSMAYAARLAEKALLGASSIWPGVDYPNRSLMSESLLSALSNGPRSLHSLRSLIEGGFGTAQPAIIEKGLQGGMPSQGGGAEAETAVFDPKTAPHEAATMPTADDEPEAASTGQQRFFRLGDLRQGLGPQTEAKGDGEPAFSRLEEPGEEKTKDVRPQPGPAKKSAADALPGKGAAAISVGGAYALYAILICGEATAERRLAYASQAEKIRSGLREHGAGLKEAFVVPLAGSAAKAAFTGFQEATLPYRLSIAPGTYPARSTHVLTIAYAAAEKLAGEGESLFVYFIDDTDSYAPYGRNFSLLLAKFQALEETGLVRCFYTCGDRQPSAGPVYELIGPQEALRQSLAGGIAGGAKQRKAGV